MNYYEGIDYWVRYVEFPNMASESVVASHGDGTFTIYINTLFPLERQLDRLEHEIRHLECEHFYRDDLEVSLIEHQADGGKSLPITRSMPGNTFLVFRSDDLPVGTSFAFRAPSGLQPIINEGQTVLCDDQQLRPGDIGLFGYEGNTICRQYHKDIFGITYLFSLNRTMSEKEDIIIPSAKEKDLICYGRVCMEWKLALPGL